MHEHAAGGVDDDVGAGHRVGADGGDRAYNLYEYDIDGVSGIGSAAALAVPTTAFNANAAQASHATRFTASAATYEQSASFPSNQIVMFRAVPAAVFVTLLHRGS